MQSVITSLHTVITSMHSVITSLHSVITSMHSVIRCIAIEQSTRILGRLGRCNPMFFLQPAVPCTQLRSSRCQYIPHTHLASIRPTALSSTHFFPPTRCNMVMGHPHAAKTARSTNTERADAFDRQYLAETFLQCDPSV